MTGDPKALSAGFRTVRDTVLRRISSGEYPAGELLPIETELAREFSCARATVNRAMRELAEEGYIDRKRRAGSRVKVHPVRKARLAVPLVRTEVTEKGAVYRYSLLDCRTCRAEGWLSRRLELSPGARLLRVLSMHFSDDCPYLYEERWINLAVIPEAASAGFGEISANEWLVSRVPFSDLKMSFHAAGAPVAAASGLGIEPGTPILVGERQTWLDGASITFARLHYHAGYRLSPDSDRGGDGHSRSG